MYMYVYLVVIADVMEGRRGQRAHLRFTAAVFSEDGKKNCVKNCSCWASTPADLSAEPTSSV